MSEVLNSEHLRQWIGREETVTDHLSAALVNKFQSTIGLPNTSAQSGESAPRLIHFCLCQPAVPNSELGEDGHPARGGFLPPVPLPRRMWAGSNIAFFGDLLVGDSVTRQSTIADVVIKEGRTGTLCFVTVDHAISGNAGVVARDRQTIVYRGFDSGAPRKPAEPATTGHSSAVIRPSSTLLFRYSALTFNGHRIHYDRPYATNVEGYPGLVVQGPLQATLLYHFAAQLHDGCKPVQFNFRSTSTLYDNEDFCLHAGTISDGKLDLWSAHSGGPIAMQAEAQWR